NGATRAAIQHLPSTALRVPPTTLVSVQSLVIEHHPAQTQEFDAARTTVHLQLTSPGLQSATVVTLDLISLKDATIFFGKADVCTGQQVLQLRQPVGTLMGQERQISVDELAQHLDHLHHLRSHRLLGTLDAIELALEAFQLFALRCGEL